LIQIENKIGSVYTIIIKINSETKGGGRKS